MLVWFQFVAAVLLQIPGGQLSLHTFVHAALEMCSELRWPDVGFCVPFITLLRAPSTYFVGVLKNYNLFLFNSSRTPGVSYSVRAAAVVTRMIVGAILRGKFTLAESATRLFFVASRSSVSIQLAVFAKFGFINEWMHSCVRSFSRNVNAVRRSFLVKC